MRGTRPHRQSQLGGVQSRTRTRCGKRAIHHRVLEPPQYKRGNFVPSRWCIPYLPLRPPRGLQLAGYRRTPAQAVPREMTKVSDLPRIDLICGALSQEEEFQLFVEGAPGRCDLCAQDESVQIGAVSAALFGIHVPLLDEFITVRSPTTVRVQTINETV